MFSKLSIFLLIISIGLYFIFNLPIFQNVFNYQNSTRSKEIEEQKESNHVHLADYSELLDMGCVAYDYLLQGNFDAWQNNLQTHFEYNQVVDLIKNMTLLLEKQLEQTSSVDLSQRSKFPIAQKILIGNSQNSSKIIVLGDTHGSSCGVSEIFRKLKDICQLDNWQLGNCHIVFLGDVMDRGENSLELLILILMLKLHNLEKVIYLRGNHENLDLMERFGTVKEFNQKFNQEKDIEKQKYFFITLDSFFNRLPAVLYIGYQNDDSKIHYSQFSHGSFEPGWNPYPFLEDPNIQFINIDKIERVNQLKNVFKLSKDRTFKLDIYKLFDNDFTLGEQFDRDPFLGFYWADFCLRDELYFLRGRGLSYGRDFIEHFFDYLPHQNNVSLKGIFRAHQHNNALGPILDELIKQKGVVNMKDKFWKRKQNDQSHYFFSILSASESYLGFPYHSMISLDFSKHEITHFFKDGSLGPNEKWETTKKQF